MSRATTIEQPAPPAERRRPGLRTIAGRVPTAAWICAFVAVLNALAWSMLSPAFMVPDENSHYAYTEYLVQHGQPPRTEAQDKLSTSESLAMRALKFAQLQFQPQNGALWTPHDGAQLRHDLQLPASRSDGNGAAKELGGEPPLFYALQAAPYALAGSGTVLDRLTLMRLLSSLLAGVTVLFIFFFLREALPDLRLAWTVGALGIAFQPMFTFVSSGMNSDALLYAAAAALFFLFARVFRRGLTPGRAVAVGAAMGVGLMTKYNFAGLVPGAALALAIVAVRQEGRRIAALRLPALALGVAFAPVLLEVALNVGVWDRPAVGATASNYSTAHTPMSFDGWLSYVWQFYLFPLPGMQHDLLGVFAPRTLWFNAFIGSYGWVETEFRPWFYDLALVPAGAIVVLAVAALRAHRDVLRARRPELLAYGALAAGMMLYVATASYIIFLKSGGSSVAQPRYLFPLLSLYALLLAVATRGAGRRWAPAVSAAIVVLAIAHMAFSELLVLSRYYA